MCKEWVELVTISDSKDYVSQLEIQPLAISIILVKHHITRLSRLLTSDTRKQIISVYDNI